jgi:hypothetical protein
MKISDIERIAGSIRYQIVSGDSPHELTNKVNKLTEEGWKPSGSHQVVITREQNRYSGSQHMDTLYKPEYTQTMIITLDDFINIHSK